MTVSLDGAIGALQGKSITEMDGGMNSPRRFLFRFSCSLVFYCFLFFLFLLSIYISMLFFFFILVCLFVFSVFCFDFSSRQIRPQGAIVQAPKKRPLNLNRVLALPMQKKPTSYFYYSPFFFFQQKSGEKTRHYTMGRRSFTFSRILWLFIFFGSLFSSILGYSSSFFEISFRLLYFY